MPDCIVGNVRRLVGVETMYAAWISEQLSVSEGNRHPRTANVEQAMEVLNSRSLGSHLFHIGSARDTTLCFMNENEAHNESSRVC